VPRVLLLGDGGSPGQLDRARQLVPALLYVAVGQSDRNVAITGVELFGEREPACRVQVTSFSETSMTVQLAGGRDGPVSLELSPRSDQLVTVPLEAAGAACLWLEGEDVFPRDDRAYVGTVPWSPWRVVVAADEPGERALLAAGLAALGDRVDRQHAWGTTLQGLATAPVPAVEAVVTAGGRLRRLLPGCSYMLLGTAAPDLGITVTGELARPTVWQRDETHPLLAGVGLEELAPGSALAVDLAPDFRVLARDARGSPLVAIRPLDGGRQVAFVACRPAGSGLGHLPAFPVLLRNALASFRERRAVTVEGAYRLGEVIEPRRPVADRRPVPVCIRTSLDPQAPVRRLPPVPVVDGRFRYTDTAWPGLYGFEIEGRWRWAGVNGSPAPAESDIRITPGTHTLADVAAGVPRPATRRPLTRALLRMAALLFVLDALLFAVGRRRRTV
jgi:hypothetical protein